MVFDHWSGSVRERAAWQWENGQTGHWDCWACWQGSQLLGKRGMAIGVRNVTCVRAAGEDHARELAIGPRKRRALLGQAVAERKGLGGLDGMGL